MSDETIVSRVRFEREAKQALRNYGAGASNPYPTSSLYHVEWANAFADALKVEELEGSAA